MDVANKRWKVNSRTLLTSTSAPSAGIMFSSLIS
ncbi:hypothetical protein PF006_g21675 [Phytophthora fragariae]|uniref:Uncharacterized protein n=1 Tax=Phytophthora fragariae TaxID=53985 RepID=A0A6A3RWD7_9STRA|nr:hypothetical protein PF003_g21704 [Phytophthora fragariae]KAE8986172.1 hypothetical protein PF011_g20101 [Phytophthora fragariae]KAE9105326.1 hypothetical protein PF006_g21675 [Phytophthora fragariae]KAE9194537.1 hypothetical protein PF004_g20698 [Phytophthora fragariae]